MDAIPLPATGGSIVRRDAEHHPRPDNKTVTLDRANYIRGD